MRISLRVKVQLILKSYAKLNLFLKVLAQRKDGYHSIKTLFERISLCDKIILKPRPDKSIKIICNNPDVPKDSANLCYRAARLLQEVFNIETGVDIRIIKNIPVGSGLGGGSSNAAVVLSGLNKLWRLNLSPKKLAQLAQEIGSDVPFFIYNTPFALGTGRGDRLKPLPRLKGVRLWHILVVPKFKVATPLIYKRWDTLFGEGRAGLTRPKYDVNILILALQQNRLSFRSELLFNGLEEATFSLRPQGRRIKEKLRGLGVQSILMSGSGPAVFGIVSSKKEAVSLSRKLRKYHNLWRFFVARTL